MKESLLDIVLSNGYIYSISIFIIFAVIAKVILSFSNKDTIVFIIKNFVRIRQ
jgi:hypothetical protein